MAADALAPRVAKSSATIVLTMQDKQAPVFHREGFQLPVPSHSWEMIYLSMFSQKKIRIIGLTYDWN